MAAAERLMLMGGTFDPVHHGHLICARVVAETLGFDRVVLVPAGQPPHKAGPAACGADRLAMLRLAVEGEALFEVSDVELRREGRSFTVHTLEALLAQRPGAALHWLIGADMLADLHLWHRVRDVLDLARIVVMVRPPWDRRIDEILLALGRHLPPEQVETLRYHIVPTPLVDISSSDIRRRMAEGRSVRYLMPDSVREYLIEKRIYR